MRRLVLAFAFLTVMPMPRVRGEAADFAGMLRWFPVVGLVLGGMLLGASRIGGSVDGWTAALAVVVVWAWLTGMLHLDGLADVVDAAAAAHRDPERLLAVMKDPHVGSFGVVAIVLQLLAKLILVHAVLSGGGDWQLVLVPAAARVGPMLWAKMPPLGSGLGAAVATGGRGAWPLALFWLVAIAVAVPPLLVAPLLIAGWAWWLRRRLGGVNGDGHGAGIELVELGLVAALAVAGHV